MWNREQRRLRTPWRLVAGGLLSGVLLAGIGAATAPLPDASAIADPAVASVYGTAVTLLLTTLLVGAVLVTSRTVDRREIGDLGLRVDRRWWVDCVVGTAVGLAVTAAIAGLAVLAGLARVTGVLVARPVDSAVPIVDGTPAAVGVVLVAAFFVGVAASEEVVVRGYLLKNLAEGLAGPLGTTGAAAAAGGATAALFGLLHATNPSATPAGVATIAVAGLFLAATYALTGRLGLPIGFHLGWNFGLGGVLGLPVSGFPADAALVAVELSGPTVLTGGEFGPEGGLSGLFALLLATAVSLWWIRREYGLAVAPTLVRPALRVDPPSDPAPESPGATDGGDDPARDGSDDSARDGPGDTGDP